MLSDKNIQNRLFVIFLLCVFTLLLFIMFEQYHVVGKNLLLNGQFDEGLNYWIDLNNNAKKKFIEVNNEQLLIHSNDSGVDIFQILNAPDTQFVQISADAAITGIVEGEERWQKARVYLLSQIRDKVIHKQKHLLYAMTGTVPWRYYQEIIPIYPLADKLKLGIYVPKGGGVMVLDNLTLRPAIKNPVFHFFSIFLSFIWFIALVWTVFPFVRGKAVYTVLLPGLLIVILMILPGQMKNVLILHFIEIVQGELSINMDARLINLWSTEIFSFPLTIARAAHYILFFVFTLIVSFVRKGFDMSTLLVLCSMATVTEILQLLTINRDASFLDLSANLMGVFTAGFVVVLFRMFVNYNKESSVL